MKKRGRFPDFLIIGAAKCGTTTLHYYLGLHPNISMSREKELNFFIEEHNWNRGIEWYVSNFRNNKLIQGESSPNYTKYPFFTGVPEKIYSLKPGMKFIYSVRDPIERIISHYLHNYSIGQEERNINDALRSFDNNQYVMVSRYYFQLEQYLRYFPRNQILVISLEELFKDRLKILQTIFSFLMVDDTFHSPEFQKIKHITSEKGQKNRLGLFLKKLSETKPAKLFSTDFRMNIGRILYKPFSKRIDYPELDISIREQLISYLKDDIKHLKGITEKDFNYWSI